MDGWIKHTLRTNKRKSRGWYCKQNIQFKKLKGKKKVRLPECGSSTENNTWSFSSRPTLVRNTEECQSCLFFLQWQPNWLFSKKKKNYGKVHNNCCLFFSDLYLIGVDVGRNGLGEEIGGDGSSLQVVMHGCRILACDYREQTINQINNPLLHISNYSLPYPETAWKFISSKCSMTSK